MEPKRFDHLSRALAAHSPRRGFLRLLAAVPIVGGLLGILTPEETDAAGRRKRRKKAHKHGKGRKRPNRKHKKKKPQCTPTTCAAEGKRCGTIPDGCGWTLDCGPCTCDTGCPDCQICQNGACVADAAQSGNCCDGTTGVCASGSCTPCDAFPNSACNAAMGTCACTPDSTCPGGKVCGTASDGCGGTITCTGCTGVCVGESCESCGYFGRPCCAGNTCNAGYFCSAGTCQPCGSSGNPCCPGDTCGTWSFCSAGKCEECGSYDYPCCPDGTCNPGLTCQVYGRCEP